MLTFSAASTSALEYDANRSATCEAASALSSRTEKDTMLVAGSVLGEIRSAPTRSIDATPARTCAMPPSAGGGEGGGGEGGLCTLRDPQSAQSVPRVHSLYSAPGPPSSQFASPANSHVLVQL